MIWDKKPKPIEGRADYISHAVCHFSDGIQVQVAQSVNIALRNCRIGMVREKAKEAAK